MADFIQTRNIENRPFHRACINRKLPCPHISCRGEAGKVFFEEKGLAQHFRAKHVGRREEIYSGSVVVVKVFARGRNKAASRKAHCRTPSSGLF